MKSTGAAGTATLSSSWNPLCLTSSLNSPRPAFWGAARTLLSSICCCRRVDDWGFKSIVALIFENSLLNIIQNCGIKMHSRGSWRALDTSVITRVGFKRHGHKVWPEWVSTLRMPFCRCVPFKRTKMLSWKLEPAGQEDGQIYTAQDCTHMPICSTSFCLIKCARAYFQLPSIYHAHWFLELGFSLWI